MNPAPPLPGSRTPIRSFSRRAGAAILLKVPSSGEGWLDEMIFEARRLDATTLPAPGQPLATAQNSAPSEDVGSKKPEGGATPPPEACKRVTDEVRRRYANATLLAEYLGTLAHANACEAMEYRRQLRVARTALESITHDMGASPAIHKLATLALDQTKP